MLAVRGGERCWGFERTRAVSSEYPVTATLRLPVRATRHQHRQGLELHAVNGQRRLYIDALNYNQEFLLCDDHYQSVRMLPAVVAEFVEAARRSGWEEVAAFIDWTVPSDEAAEKWRSRRAREVEEGERNVTCNINVLLAEAFKEAGARVLLSLEADNDDTLAAYAQVDGAAVLSRDRDFFRYRGRTYTIYQDFSIDSSELDLGPEADPPRFRDDRPPPAPRDLQVQPLPLTTDTDPTAFLLKTGTPEFNAGTPSPLVRLLGSPHRSLVPLRAALYHQLGLGPVKEVYPVWEEDTQSVVFDQGYVQPDPAFLDLLLGEPEEAINALFPREAQAIAALFTQAAPGTHSGTALAAASRPDGCSQAAWLNHLHGVRCCVLHLHCLATGKELLPLVLSGAARLPAPTAAQRRVLRPPAHEYSCKECGDWVEMSAGEVNFFASKGFTLPRRCKACRAAEGQGGRRAHWS